MSLLVVGSIALDSVRTPCGEAEDVLGGSAVYFCCAAALFTQTRLVGVVGDDFPEAHRKLLAQRGVDARGLVVRRGRTFRWRGAYEGDMSSARTVAVELNVFRDFEPEIPAEFRDSSFAFLANGSPALQRHVRRQLERRAFVVADTMNHWIENARDELRALLAEVDGVVLNDAEARSLSGRQNLAHAAKEILAMGPRLVVIKKGEHGAVLMTGEEHFAAPAFPTLDVVDPTGAGDSFAGGMMGCLASAGRSDLSTLRRAIVYGSVVASFAVEGFSVAGLCAADRSAVDARFRKLVDMMRVEG
ncbi:MAG: PfkB family carbohydrate kinase [Planctomycetota bacterium]